MITENRNLFRRSIGQERFLSALAKGEVLNFSGEVVRVTREAMKSCEYIDATRIQGAKYPIYLAYAKEDMEAVLAYLCPDD